VFGADGVYSNTRKLALNQALLDLTREGPVPDEQMDRAKNGIDLRQIVSDLR
jgi:hypothetical protein